MSDTTAPAAEVHELCTTWLGWFDAGEDDDQPWFPERRSEIADHLRAVAAVLAELEQLRANANPADADPEYGRWLTRNLGAAFDAGWHTHAELVIGTLATLGEGKREQCGRAWVTERLADLTENKDGEQQEQEAAIEVRGFADLCEAMEQLGVTFEGELRPREDEQPQDERGEALDRLRRFVEACNPATEILAGPPTHDAPYLSLSDLETVLGLRRPNGEPT